MNRVSTRCYDFPGPSEPAIATSQGWVPLTEAAAAEMAASAMLLACGPEHIERLRAEEAAADRSGLDRRRIDL